MTTIIGTGGDDRLVGGTGEDIFLFGASHGTDTIWGFTDGEGLIGLRGISGITPKRTSMVVALPHKRAA